MKVLIQNNAYVDAVEEYHEDDKEFEFTALHCAAWRGHADIVKVLIQSGCQQYDFETPPLHMAAYKGHAEVVKILIRNGADVHDLCESHWTALDVSASEDREAAKILIRNGADINDGDSQPLQIAADNYHVPYLLELLCLGAEISSNAVKSDQTELLRPIKDRVESLRAGNGMKNNVDVRRGETLHVESAFSLMIAYGGAAFKAYYSIRSFITFHGIFMGPGYDIGNGSI